MRRVLIVVAAAVLLASCKVDTTVSVHVNRDGSGTVAVRVALDPDAVANAEAGGAKLETRIRVNDLQAAGWQVSPWRRAKDGSAVLQLRKGFGNAAGLRAVFAELNGKQGPVRDVQLTRHRGLLDDTYRFRATADLSKLSSGLLSDPELVGRLTAQQVDLNQIDAQLAQELRSGFRLRIRVDLPGGPTKVFAPRPGHEQSMSTGSSQLQFGRVLLLLAAVVLASAAVILLLRPRRAPRRRPRARPPA